MGVMKTFVMALAFRLRLSTAELVMAYAFVERALHVNPSLMRIYSVRPMFLGGCVLATKLTHDNDFRMRNIYEQIDDVLNTMNIRLLVRAPLRRSREPRLLCLRRSCIRPFSVRARRSTSSTRCWSACTGAFRAPRRHLFNRSSASLHLLCISSASPLHLRCISSASPLHLHCISHPSPPPRRRTGDVYHEYAREVFAAASQALGFNVQPPPILPEWQPPPSRSPAALTTPHVPARVAAWPCAGCCHLDSSACR